MLQPRDQRTRTNEEIAIALRRQLAGTAWRRRPRQPVRRQQPAQRLLGGGGQNNNGGSSRLPLEIRGHDLDDARRMAQDARDADGGHRRASPTSSIGREEGRPEIAVRVDRPKAAMLGMTVASVATTIQTNVAGTTAAQFRERGNEYPVVVRLREADREAISDVGDVLLSTPSGQVVPAKNVMPGQPRGRSGADRAQEHGARHPRERGDRGTAQRRGQGRRRRASASCACRPTSPSASVPEVEEQAQVVPRSCGWC